MLDLGHMLIRRVESRASVVPLSPIQWEALNYFMEIHALLAKEQRMEAKQPKDGCPWGHPGPRL